ncbi:hypothetical protein [Hydrogenophaga sp.]|uniref:hypothetical protein n=1 Tax=Hydrogenophaga sp. TaxID=1904254 RepID=UPI002611949E|nr:hypothetical protein [Hydrogenophaga sp.]MDM7949202.1 hypothetical protein [Hydrogenophaga sp.]
MKRFKKTLVALSMLSLLGACGGGDEDIGNAIALNVNPTGFTHLIATCPAGGVTNGLSIHIINGGFGPFRVKATVTGLTVGFANGNVFVPPTASQINSEGFMLVDGQDPSFAVNANLACGSDVGVVVLDSRSNSVTINIKVDAPAE